MQGPDLRDIWENWIWENEEKGMLKMTLRFIAWAVGWRCHSREREHWKKVRFGKICVSSWK